MRLNRDKVLLVMARKGIRQMDLAVAAGMSRGNLSTIVNGKNCKPETIIRIADALETDFSEIIETEK